MQGDDSGVENAPLSMQTPGPFGKSAKHPDKLYFHYKLEDSRYTKTFTVSGNYDVKYSFPN